MLKKSVILAGVFLVSLGCGKPAEKKPTDETVNRIKNDSSRLATPTPGASATSFEGLWMSNCEPLSKLSGHLQQLYTSSAIQNSDYSGLVAYSFTKDAFVKTALVYFRNDGCDNDDDIISYTQVLGKMALSRANSAGSSAASYEFFFTPDPGKMKAWKNQGLSESETLWFGNEVSASSGLPQINYDFGFYKY